MSNIRLLVVEDHLMVRMGLSMMMEKIDGIELVGEAEDGLDGVNKAKTLLPDVVLMDIGLPEIDGIEATKRIKEFNQGIKILMFTSRDSEDDVLTAFEAGANGYIMKGANIEQTERAIKSVADGTGWLDPQIAKIVLSNIQRNNKPIINNSQTGINYKDGKNLYGLTEREMEILSLMVEGLSNPQIAEKCVITKSTAKAHVHSILQKLCVSKRTKAVRIAMEEGLV
ncbi:response regulator transcription factor [bacterium]|nr:response regulator transcription factor [bacterium]